MTFPEFQRADSDRCSSWKGGDAQTRKEQAGNNSEDLGKGPGFPSGDTQWTIS